MQGAIKLKKKLWGANSEKEVWSSKQNANNMRVGNWKFGAKNLVQNTKDYITYTNIYYVQNL